MLRGGSQVVFCNGTIYLRNATTQILRICQKVHFPSIQIIKTTRKEIVNSHNEPIYPPFPTPNGKKDFHFR